MMLDLGKYGSEILGSYAVTIGLLVVLLAFSWIKGRRVARELRVVEQRWIQNNE